MFGRKNRQELERRVDNLELQIQKLTREAQSSLYMGRLHIIPKRNAPTFPIIKEFLKQVESIWEERRTGYIKNNRNSYNVFGFLFDIRNNFIADKSGKLVSSVGFSDKIFEGQFTEEQLGNIEEPYLRCTTWGGELFFFYHTPDLFSKLSDQYSIFGDEFKGKCNEQKDRGAKFSDSGIYPVCVFDLDKLKGIPQIHKDNEYKHHSPFYDADPSSCFGFDFERQIEKALEVEWERVRGENSFARNTENEGFIKEDYFRIKKALVFENDYFLIEYREF